VSSGENSLRALGRGAAIHCRRLLAGWMRDPVTAIQALVYPALTLLMLWIVFGNTITEFTGEKSVYRSVPMITVIAAMSGAMVSGIGLTEEKRLGLLSRFATLPTHRAAGIAGRMLAEGVRVLITTGFILAVGVAIGFRFTQGPLASVAMVGLPLMYGLGFAVLVTAVATVSRGVLVVNIIGIVTSLLMFFNSGFVPIEAYPDWLQTVVADQPMTCVVEAMHGLAFGGPVAAAACKTLAWSLGSVVVFAYPALRGLRRAAEQG
jgi:ABC-2 type transport system permease protein